MHVLGNKLSAAVFPVPASTRDTKLWTPNLPASHTRGARKSFAYRNSTILRGSYFRSSCKLDL